MDDILAAREANREAKRKHNAVVIENLLAEKKAKSEAKQARLDHTAADRAATAASKATIEAERAAAAAASIATKEAERKEKAATEAAVASRLDHAALMPSDAAVAARLDHEASLRTAEREFANASTTASKAILEFERKMKKA